MLLPLATAVVLMVCARSWRLGDQYATWVVMSAVLFAGAAVVVAQDAIQIAGVDLIALLMATMLIASSLVLRHILIMRERFGRAVQGRAEVTRFRDPLTVLLSYEGFECEVENMVVRQQSNSLTASLL